MDYPEFPKGFASECCPRVEAARRRHDESPEDFAECSFKGAGLGLICQECRLHLTRPFLHYEKDRKWLPRLEQYYKELKKCEENQEKFNEVNPLLYNGADI